MDATTLGTTDRKALWLMRYDLCVGCEKPRNEPCHRAGYAPNLRYAIPGHAYEDPTALGIRVPRTGRAALPA